MLLNWRLFCLMPNGARTCKSPSILGAIFFMLQFFLKIDYVRFVAKWCPPRGLKPSYLVCQFTADSPFWSLDWKAVE